MAAATELVRAECEGGFRCLILCVCVVTCGSCSDVGNEGLKDIIVGREVDTRGETRRAQEESGGPSYLVGDDG